jgi:protein-S-isoprenylcysteine O-methyltransferase Ste14
MTIAAAALAVAFFLIAFVARSFLQRKRTGDWGFRLDRDAGPLPRVASVLMIVGFLSVFAGLACDLTGCVDPVSVLDHNAVRGAGLAVMIVAFGSTAKAQLDLRESWRIGVDPAERTELVIDRSFAVVRNPIFTGMLLFALGAAGVVPNILAIAGAVIVIAGVELQVRGVEEPYLLEAHREAYLAYARRVGRFLPRVGRLR